MMTDIPKEIIAPITTVMAGFIAWFMKKTLGRITKLEERINGVEINQQGISTTLSFILKSTERIEKEVLRIHEKVDHKVDKD